MARRARVSEAPVRIIHYGETFQFPQNGLRQVSQEEEAILSTYTSDRFSITFEDTPEPKTKEGK